MALQLFRIVGLSQFVSNALEIDTLTRTQESKLFGKNPWLDLSATSKIKRSFSAVPSCLLKKIVPAICLITQKTIWNDIALRLKECKNTYWDFGFLIAISSGHWAFFLSDIILLILFHNCNKYNFLKHLYLSPWIDLCLLYFTNSQGFLDTYISIPSNGK